ncbi:MAG TPA: ATP-binding cassette domain-containing protein [Anaerolineales bacterium]|jgi:ABC-2 type transport system ATP-binding protein
MNAIEVNSLKKSFHALQAVRGASFAVEKGEVLSLLGPNGAGKSTTISMLSGLLVPDGGEAIIMGHSVMREPEAARQSLGIVPQDIALYPDLSARENLDFWGKMYGLRGSRLKTRVDEVLAIIGLSDRQKDMVGTYSGGMKRRVNIGAALLHQPDVIIMDEPTVGIDPQSRRHILDNVKELNRQGMTVLYTTHYMEEAAELSQHIAIMDKGKVIAFGTHDELIRLTGGQTCIDLGLNSRPEAVLTAWKQVEGVSKVTPVEAPNASEPAPRGKVEAGKVAVLVDDSNRVLPRLFESAARLSVRITTVEIQEPNLEMVFLSLTGRALRD